MSEEWLVIYEPPPNPPGVAVMGGPGQGHMRVEASSAKQAVELAVEARPSWGDPGLARGGEYAESRLWTVPVGDLVKMRIVRRYEVVAE